MSGITSDICHSDDIQSGIDTNHECCVYITRDEGIFEMYLFYSQSCLASGDYKGESIAVPAASSASTAPPVVTTTEEVNVEGVERKSDDKVEGSDVPKPRLSVDQPGTPSKGPAPKPPIASPNVAAGGSTVVSDGVSANEFPDIPSKDAFYVFRAMCRLSTKVVSDNEPVDSLEVKSKVLSLELLNAVLVNTGTVC